jgi:hypothetical protein
VSRSVAGLRLAAVSVAIAAALLVLVAPRASGTPGSDAVGTGQEPLGTSPVDVDRARDAAREILADPRYDEPSPTVVERIGKWIGDRFQSLIERLVLSGSGDLLGTVVIVTMIGLVAFFVVRFGSTVQPDRRRRHDGNVMVELTRSPAEWRREAEALEAAGRFKEALRCRYRALVGELVQRDLIPEIPGRTAGEYVRDVQAGEPDAAAAFAAATELFELAWYADVATGADECARFGRLDATVLSHAGRRREHRELAAR